MRYYLIAGEASGDLHGSNLMKELKKEDSKYEFRFWGGDLMSKAGGTLVRHYKDTAVMGLIEVLMNLGKISKNLKLCKSDIISYQPDVLILIDYPGFNLRIAEFAKAHNIKVFYYIAPKVWAWKEQRIKKIKKYVDSLFIIFPFETEYFKEWGIDAIYKGNPLIDSIAQDISNIESRTDFLNRSGLEDKPIIAILPGSRKMEIKYLMPRIVEVEKKLSQSKFSNYQLVLAAAPSTEEDTFNKYLKDSKIKVIFNKTYSILKQADAAIISSGTASLEAALIGTPQVVCYGMNEISFQVANRILKINYVSLANLILKRQIFTELLQHDCTPKKILAELTRLLNENDYKDTMLKSYAELHDILGGKGASEKIASAMVSKLNSK
ncbi:MAG: lipid-A-disaccharide synthase [Bacteroidales bacterium]|jgi:lipid-A-disaccharide synthase